MELLKSMHWRHATKRMNGRSVPDAQISQIIETARMAPTSSGLQPFKMILIQDPELKKQLLPIAMNQSQVVECSHLLVFAAWDSYTETRLNRVFDHMENVRELPKGEMDAYKGSVLASMQALSPEAQFQHAARQAYIAFGLALGAAAELKVDASPMEGFHNDQLDAFLGLEQEGLRSVTLLALGYRDDQNDWLAPLKKVRLPLDELLIVKESK